MFICAERVPVPVGLNTTLIVHVVFPGTLPPWKLQVLLGDEKSGFVPVKVRLEMAIGTEPRFWKFTFMGALVVPTVVGGKVRVVGVTFTADPFPLINTPCFANVKLP